MSRRLASGVVRDVLVLGLSQYSSYVLGIVALPLLIRSGVDSWAHLAVGLSVGTVMRSVVEYGFELSAVSRIAQKRFAGMTVVDDVAGVTTARLMLAAGTMPIALAYLFASGQIRAAAAVSGLGMLAGLLPGLQFTWALQSLNLLPAVPRTELLPRLALVGASLPVVAVTRDVIPYVLALIASSVITLALQRRLLRREGYGHLWAGYRGGITAMRWGGHLFLFRLFVVAFTSANVALLAVFGNTTQVAIFAAAERLARAATAALAPAAQALLPRMSIWVYGNSAHAMRIALAAIVGPGFLLSLALFVFADYAGSLVGGQLGGIGQALRLLSPLPLLVSVSNVLGVQWLVPRGGQRYLNWAVAIGAVVNLGLAAGLVPKFGALGMSIAVVSAELTVTVVLMLVATRHRGAEGGLSSGLVANHQKGSSG